jgi:hypothetical protein
MSHVTMWSSRLVRSASAVAVVILKIDTGREQPLRRLRALTVKVLS